ncbi:MAG: acyltransferase [Bacteroides sp.]|nr:acyltransferase [Bacteroides sp.]
MNNLTILLVVLVGILYLKWIAVFFLYIMEIFWCLYQKHKPSLFYKVLAMPSYALIRILRNGGGRFVLFNISAIPSNHIRKQLYRGLGVSIEKNVTFHFRAEIRAPYKLKIGRGTIIGDNALLDARSSLTIGRNVNLSSNVSIYTLQHDHRDSHFRCPDPSVRKMSVEIDDRAWIGSNVVVLPGVHIGEGAVCCAGCVVTKDVPPYTVVAGIPAKKVGERPRVLEYEFSGKTCRLY